MARITRTQYTHACQLAREVFQERRERTDAISILKAAGLNEASAAYFIEIYRRMRLGVAYHRAMSIDQTRHFLRSIAEHDGTEALNKAVAAFAEHLPYLRESNGNSMPGLTKLLEEFAAATTQRPAIADAISDLAGASAEGHAPDRATRLTTYFKRDTKIRAHVLARAKGACEYCGALGFTTANGNRYIETHHIISLAKQGPDSLKNVIGLCASHHREAHFGANADDLEREFLQKLSTLQKA